MTQNRIREWYDAWNGQVYVSFSGGKDSTVLKHIVDNMYDDIPAVFVNTGLEYPEIQRFVRDVKEGKFSCFNSDVEIIVPEMRFDKVIETYGYPVISKAVSQKIEEARRKPDGASAQYFIDGTESTTRYDGRYSMVRYRRMLDAPFKISHKCCNVMKKRPAKRYEKETGRKPIIGTLACESQLRETAWIKDGCNAFQVSRPKSAPLSFWTEQDILRYIKKFNMPYCPVYGDIQIKKFKRSDVIEGQMNIVDYLGDYEAEDILETTGCKMTGCMFCAFGIMRDKTPNRFQRMKVTHPKQYAYCMEQLGLKEVLEYIGVPYE